MSQFRPFDTAPSLTDRVAASLREAITSLELAPGAAIVEATIARQLGVSTTPVREALHRLAKDGLVALNPYRGATVVNLTVEDVQEIYQLREVLEPLAIKLATPRLTERDIAAMQTLLDEAAAAIVEHDQQELSLYNRRFHGMFIAQCGNDRLRQMLENLQELNRIIALRTWRHRGYDEREQAEHLAILDAVQRRDGNGAAERVRLHIVRFGQSIVSVWDEESSELTTREEVTR